MTDYTHRNLKDDVENSAEKFGLSPDLETRFARKPLELREEASATSAWRRTTPSHSGTGTAAMKRSIS